jgi:hypothetical protein
VSKSNRSNDANYDKLLREASDFDNSASSMVTKMNKAVKKMNELDVESDLKYKFYYLFYIFHIKERPINNWNIFRLRQDLIDMEYRMLEAEVATIISRGDTLVRKYFLYSKF